MTFLLHITCLKCKTVYDISVTSEQIDAWEDGLLTEYAMPHLSPAERELFVTRICGNCSDKRFKY